MQPAAVMHAALFLGLWAPIWIGFEGWGSAHPLFFLAILARTALFIIGAVSLSALGRRGRAVSGRALAAYLRPCSHTRCY